MLLDRLGYILSETFMLLVIISLTKGILCLRRRPSERRFLGQDDVEAFFQPITLAASAPVRFFRYAIIFTSVAAIGAIEIFILSPFGAAIITGALLVSCAAIVHRGLVKA